MFDKQIIILNIETRCLARIGIYINQLKHICHRIASVEIPLLPESPCRRAIRQTCSCRQRAASGPQSAWRSSHWPRRKGLDGVVHDLSPRGTCTRSHDASTSRTRRPSSTIDSFHFHDQVAAIRSSTCSWCDHRPRAHRTPCTWSSWRRSAGDGPNRDERRSMERMAMSDDR